METFRILAIDADRRMRVAEPGEPGANAAWVVFADKRIALHPDLPGLLQRHGAERPEIDVFYGDEVLSAGRGQDFAYLCKPEFDETQLIARDYVGLPVVLRGRALGRLSLPRDRAGVYELLLDAAAEGLGIARIPEVLGMGPEEARAIGRERRAEMVARYLANGRGDCEVVPGLLDDSLELRRRFDDPPHVTLVVPTSQSAAPEDAGGRPMLLALLESLAHTDWPMDRLHVLVGDDASEDEYAWRAWPFRLERVPTARAAGEAFNYAAKMNALWRHARTELLVLMNDDIVVRSGGWLRALLTFAMDESVGGVGARLLYPDGRLQHVGMPAGVCGPCTHAFIGSEASEPGYQGWAMVQREWSIVTGAVFATRRTVLEHVGGFDERYRLDYNDTDLCLRLRLLGLRIVYTPHAELTHHESASRRTRHPPPVDSAIFLETWRHYLRDDPAYHPRLTRSTPMIEPILAEDDWWRDERAR